jgi:ABC-type multidrug transport system fused ATPase/permease subunit
VQDVLIRGTDSVVANALRLVGVAAIFIALQPALGLITILPIIVVGLLLGRFNGQVRPVYRAARERLGQISARLSDNLGGMRVIQSFAQERREIQAVYQLGELLFNDQVKAVQLRNRIFPVIRWVGSLGNAIMLAGGVYFIARGQFTLGGLLAYRGYGRYFFGPVDDLVSINDLVQRAAAAGRRLFEVLDTPVSVAEAPDAQDLPRPLRGALRFEGVSFSYEQEPRSQESGVRSQNNEPRSQESGVRSQNAEAGGSDAESRTNKQNGYPRIAIRADGTENREPKNHGTAELLYPRIAIRADGTTEPPNHQTNYVLKDVTLQINPGERVAILGPSGAGKSTLIALAARLYDPDSGCVTLDGHDLRSVTFNSLRSQIAQVQQETYLFNATALENLRYGRPDASFAEVEQAARAANAHEFLEKLPQGYDTLVGERGIKLSGGQKQRIAVARALLTGAPLLLLDEPTSAVEAESEALIIEGLERLMRGRTTLVVSHRLSLARSADLVVVVMDGRIVEQGRPEQLLARPESRFAAMVRADSAFAVVE